jgi:predicted ATPase
MTGDLQQVFLSYSSKDAESAARLKAALSERGCSIWMAPDDVLGGESWVDQILSALSTSSAVVVLVSEHSMSSQHVAREVSIAIDGNKSVVPVRITSTPLTGPLNYLLHLSQWIDASGGHVEDSADRIVARLGNLSEHGAAPPAHVDQVVRDHAASEFPPPGRPNLPRPTDRFHGRHREIRAIRAQLMSGCRFVTLTGPAGVGKTRLAVEVAASIADDFSGRVHWIGLAAVCDSAMVVPAIANILGARPDELGRLLGTGRALLVLDNIDQVLDAASDLTRLTTQCPGLAVLATSREALGMPGELRFSVSPLPERVAAELFCDRARLQRTPDVVELCRRLDFLPLAIELAAARAMSLSPSQMIQRIGERLDLLAARRAVEPRQRTLRAAIDWSYELLTEGEQSLLGRLSMFVGGCTLAAAETVIAATFSDLDALVVKSLVVYSFERYSLLETIRAYAHERFADAPEAATWEQAFAGWAMALVHEQDARIRGPDQQQALAILDAERDNLRSAFEVLLTDPDPDPARAFVFAASLWMRSRGHWQEVQRWYQAALDRPGGAPGVRGWALVDMCGLAWAGGDVQQSAALREEAMSVAMQCGDDAMLASALELQALAADDDTAAQLFEQASAIFNRLGLDYDCARVLINIGAAALNRADYPHAERASHQAAEMGRRIGNRRWIGAAQINEAIALVMLDRDPEARALVEDSFDIFAALADVESMPLVAHVAALLEARSGRLEQAARLLGAADSGYREMGIELEPSDERLRQMIWASLTATGASVTESSIARGRLDGAATLARSWRAGLL